MDRLPVIPIRGLRWRAGVSVITVFLGNLRTLNGMVYEVYQWDSLND
jgi:hypothetical protein